MPRLAEGIFRMLRAKNEKHIVKFSYLELYNESLGENRLKQQRTYRPYIDIVHIYGHEYIYIYIYAYEYRHNYSMY